MIKYIWSNKNSALKPLSKQEYYQDLIDLPEEVAKRALEKAWETRNFEIDLYWRRATYFWALIASTFVGYFALISSEKYLTQEVGNNVEVYFLICIGFVLSLAWHLTNIGSKQWQRHWEVHVDLLEDKFTGPLYKTVYPELTFSVSKINEIVSFMIIGIWFLLGVKYMIDQDLVQPLCSDFDVNYFVLASTMLSALAAISMIKGHGRGRFGQRSVIMFRRTVSYSSEGDKAQPEMSD